MSEKLLNEIEKRLNAKTIHDLRQIGRAVGVPRPADGRKERLLDYIMKIASGECDPAAPSVRGAHPKSEEYDRQLVVDIFRCREIFLSSDASEANSVTETVVESGVCDNLYEFNAEGILERNDGRWFIRVNGCRENFISDIFVNEYFVKTYALREGDGVSCKCKRTSLDEAAGLIAVLSVNGVAPSLIKERPVFDNLSPVYPDKVLRTARGSGDTANRIIDLLSPVGAGQRAFVIAPHGSGKTAILKGLALGIRQNKNAKVILLAVDARPEEAADFRSEFPAKDLFISPMDYGAAAHVRTARLALEYAKRQTELGLDAVLISDGLTRLARAYNLCAKQVSPVLDASALDNTKKFLSAARNLREGGSLTIISAICSDTDDIVDEAVLSGLKDVCNMKITLSYGLARQRVFPPLVVEKTCSFGDERLLSAEELQAADRLRGESITDIIKLVNSTGSNGELCEKLKR